MWISSNEHLFHPCWLKYIFSAIPRQSIQRALNGVAHRNTIQPWAALSNAEYIGNGNSMSNTDDDISNCLNCLHWTAEEESEKRRKSVAHTQRVCTHSMWGRTKNRVSKFVNTHGNFAHESHCSYHPHYIFIQNGRIKNWRFARIRKFQVEFLIKFLFSYSNKKDIEKVCSHTFLTARHEYKKKCCKFLIIPLFTTTTKPQHGK